MTTYTIKKGQRYDREGAMVTDGTLYSQYDREGRYMVGDFFFGDTDAIEAAVLRVIETGETETITTGEDAPQVEGYDDTWRAALAEAQQTGEDAGIIHSRMTEEA